MVKGDSFFVYFVHFEEKSPVFRLQTKENTLDTKQDAKLDAKVLKSSQDTLGGESSKEIIAEASDFKCALSYHRCEHRATNLLLCLAHSLPLVKVPPSNRTAEKCLLLVFD